MNRSKHSPGPWVIDGFLEEEGLFKIRPANSMLCGIHVYSAEENGYSETEIADARLVAASPEMLEALKEAATELGAFIQAGAGPRTKRALDKVIAAIIRTEGLAS